VAAKDWKPRFLKALAETGMVSEAARRAGVDRTYTYRARAADEKFAQSWADVEEEATEQLEQEAITRALDGRDPLLMFLLRSRRPDTYRDRTTLDAKVVHEHAPNEAELDEAIAEYLAKLDPSS